MARRVQHTQPFSLFSFQDIIMSVTGVIVLVTLLLTLELLQKAESSTTGQTSAFPQQIRRALEDTQEQVAELRQTVEQEQQVTNQMAAVSPGLLKRQEYDLKKQMQQLQRELATFRAQLTAVKRKQIVWKSRQFDRAADQRKLEALLQKVEALKSELDHLRQSNRVVYNPSQATGKSAWLVDIGPAMVLTAQAGKRSVPLRFDDGRLKRSSVEFIKWASTRDKSSEYFVLLIRPQGVKRYDDIRAKLNNLGFQIGFEVIGEAVVPIDSQQGAAL